MAEASNYITLRRAAQTLGVHEQTLRNWEKSGLIRLVRLPGSGYRRVSVDEVERIRREMALPQQRSGVQIVPPPVDAESLAQAHVLADAVCARLSGLESETTLDEYLESWRGRTWSS